MAKICIVNKKKIDLFKEVYENQLQRSIVTIFLFGLYSVTYFKSCLINFLKIVLKKKIVLPIIVLKIRKCCIKICLLIFTSFATDTSFLKVNLHFVTEV